MWCAVLNREGETLLIKATDTRRVARPQSAFERVMAE
jgi:hypothetical protein